MKKLLSIFITVCLLLTVAALFPSTFAKETPTFSAGTIREENSGYTIGSSDFSAFISIRTTKSLQTRDMRVVLAASKAELDKYSALDMTLTFKDEAGQAVNAITKSIGSASFPVYRTAKAAGISYTAANDCYLFGLVVTDIPNIAWNTVTASISEPASAPFVQGSVTITQAVPEFSLENGLCYDEMALNTWESYMDAFCSLDLLEHPLKRLVLGCRRNT